MALLLQSPLDEAREYAAMAAWLKAHAGEHVDPETGETDIPALVEDWALNSGQSAEPDAVLSNPYHPAWDAAKDARSRPSLPPPVRPLRRWSSENSRL